MKAITVVIIMCGLLMAGCAVLKKAPKSEQRKIPGVNNLNGEWVLNYIADAGFDTLYKMRHPTINFDIPQGKVNGNTGCNSFFGKVTVSENHLSFPDAMGMTKMYCEGNGEQLFMSALQKVNTYSINKDDRTLTLIMGDIALMRFGRK